MNHRNGRIVVGVDGSDSSIDALRWAVRQAELTSCDLEAVTSWQHPIGYEADLAAEEEDWEMLAKTNLDGALAKVEAEGVEVRRTVSQGHPAKVLTDASTDADLLVVGSRGYGGFAGMLLGSISGHVSSHAHCPVVVVRHIDAQPRASR